MHGVVPVSEAADGPYMSAARKSRFKTKWNAPLTEMVDFSKQQFPCSEGRCFRRKGRNSLRYKIRVNKVFAINVFWKKFSCKSGFTGSVWSRDNIDVWFHEASRWQKGIE